MALIINRVNPALSSEMYILESWTEFLFRTCNDETHVSEVDDTRLGVLPNLEHPLDSLVKTSHL